MKKLASIIVVIALLWALDYGYHERQLVMQLRPYTAPLKTIANQKFSHQVVPLDGNKYVGCTFDSVTFRWHGQPYAFENVHVVGSRNIEVDGTVADTVYFLGMLNLLDPQLNATLHKADK